MKKRMFVIVSLVAALLSAPLTGCKPREEKKPNINKKQQIVATMSKPSSGSPEGFSPYDNLLITAGVFYSYNSFLGKTEGQVDAKAFGFISYKQTIKNFRKKVAGEIFSQAVSYSSLKRVAEQKLIMPGRIVRRKGSGITESMTPDWDGEVTEFTEEEFLGSYGVLPFELVKYVVNAQTVKDSELKAEENGDYVFRYVLDGEAAAQFYRNEVRTLAGADKAPKFEGVSFEITIDAAWNIKKISTQEKYSITIGGIGSAVCNVKMTETFSQIDSPELKITEKEELLAQLAT